jgi:hypothetical protein
MQDFRKVEERQIDALGETVRIRELSALDQLTYEDKQPQQEGEEAPADAGARSADAMAFMVSRSVVDAKGQERFTYEQARNLPARVLIPTFRACMEVTLEANGGDDLGNSDATAGDASPSA